ncbi:hypothetical protein [Pyrolobus fumarii]|nr:hypothetical protein [Pyrolobus fumarii]
MRPCLALGPTGLVAEGERIILAGHLGQRGGAGLLAPHPSVVA